MKKNKKKNTQEDFQSDRNIMNVMYGPPSLISKSDGRGDMYYPINPTCYKCASYQYDILVDDRICTNMLSPFFCETAEPGESCYFFKEGENEC